MALVGPRPEDPRYVDLTDPLHRVVFAALPGDHRADGARLPRRGDRPGERRMRGRARQRARRTATDEDLDRAYREIVLPAKLAMDAEYLRRRARPRGDLACHRQDHRAGARARRRAPRLGGHVRHLPAFAAGICSSSTSSSSRSSIVGAMLLRFDTLRFADEALIYFPAALFPLVVRPPINIAGGLYSRAWAYASVGELARIFDRRGRRVDRRDRLLLRRPRPARRRRHRDGGRSVPALVLRARGPADARRDGRRPLPDPRLEEWKGWRPGDPDRRGGGRLADGPARSRPSSTARATSARPSCARSARRSDGLGMRVVGLLDDDRAKRNQVLRGTKVLGGLDELPEIARVTGARRLLIAIPIGVGRRRPARRGGRDAARARDTHRPAARRARLRAARRRGDPRGRGHRPAAPRPGRHRRTRACATSSPAERSSSRAPAGRSARSWRARCSTSTRRGSSCSTAPRGRSTTSTASSRCSAAATPGPRRVTGDARAELVTRLANVASLDGDDARSWARTGRSWSSTPPPTSTCR